jgi:hypothetical protein
VADTPHADKPAEPAKEQTHYLPNNALYMDWETAMHRAKALFRAICDLSARIGVDNSDTVGDLASLGEAILQDQLNTPSEPEE